MVEIRDGKKVLVTPVSAEDLADIKIGDIVYLDGDLMTCRDVAHRRLVEGGRELPYDIRNKAIFHAGPIVRPIQGQDDAYEMVSVGPTTSMRMEKFEYEFTQHTGVRVIVALLLFAVWPGKRRDELRLPFYGRNYAHRGLFGKDQCPPENSLPAFAAAAQNGYGIELDVQFTSDHRLVVFHDDTLDRMTPAKGFVHDMDWAHFSALPLAGSEEHPPLFADMLRTVAEANPATPLIVEIKSRSEYSQTYLEELCRATLAELKTYPGPYCLESFDPRVVGIVRRQAPEVLRGQLADSYQSYRKDGTHAVPAFAFSHLFGNFLGRPDFIAWCPAKRNWAVKLNAALGAMMVMWTALPEHDTAKLEAENDAVIFQWYAPKQKYRE